MTAGYRPTWAEIDLGRLTANLCLFKSKIGRRVDLMFVVKANAYGHGAVQTALAAEESGAPSWLGVSSVEEGTALREAGVKLPVLILGSLYPFESFDGAIRYGLTPTVASLEGARQLVEYAKRRSDHAAKIPCHLKLDTGMGRIGMGWPSGLQVVNFLAKEKHVVLEGVYTHLASADSDREFTNAQLDRFKAAVKDIKKSGGRVRYFHAGNSAAALKIPQSRFDLVRPGLAVYGLYGEGFKPVLTLKSRIVFVKNVKAKTPLGYGGTYRTRKNSRIATLPIGYADGVARALSNRSDVLVHGQRCPVVGAISMDMMMVDVTKAPQARVGAEVVLIGRSGREEITADELAQLTGTIPYEIVTRIAARVHRVYLK